MTGEDRRRAIDGFRRLLERIDHGELDAPTWYRERLIGAIITLDATAKTMELVVAHPSGTDGEDARGVQRTQPERFRQECDLFSVFVAGLSAIECLYFTLGYVGAMAQPDAFEFVADPRDVVPRAVADAYQCAWPASRCRRSSGPPSTARSGRRSPRPATSWRTAPGRGDTPSWGGDPEWQRATLNADTTRWPRDWVISTSAESVRAAAGFVGRLALR